MKLPPKPRVIEATADFLWRHDDCKLASSDLVRDINAWGRACAEAMREAAVKVAESENDAWTVTCADAIRNIKIED